MFAVQTQSAHDRFITVIPAEWPIRLIWGSAGAMVAARCAARLSVTVMCVRR